MTYLIRIAKESDAESMLEIYAPFIEKTAVTFEYEVPSAEDFASRIRKYLNDFPWLVCEYDGSVIAYAYAGKHRDRTAYQWSVESSVYVHPSHQQKGIARTLYNTLFLMLKEQGVMNVYAGVALPNPKSEKFHRSCGFQLIGIYSNVGYKLGSWHHVMWSHLALGKHPANPKAPISFDEFQRSDHCRMILQEQNEQLRSAG